VSISKWLFAEFYDFLNSVVESKVIPYRKITAGKCNGRVLEIGGGTGANLQYLKGCHAIDIVEPDTYMRRKLISNVKENRVNVNISPFYGENLGYPDKTFDYVFTTLVLCMVNDVDRVIDEAYRVLKLGGTFLFYEHVPSPNKFGYRFQTILDPWWKFFTTGCHLRRDIKTAINNSEFTVVEMTDFHLKINPLIKIPNIVGSAKKQE
jgi:SAM-dependent methyltransferase